MFSAEENISPKGVIGFRIFVLLGTFGENIQKFNKKNSMINVILFYTFKMLLRLFLNLFQIEFICGLVKRHRNRSLLDDFLF